MFKFMFNFFTRSIVVLLVAMLSVNYLPDKLFDDFPLNPRTVQPNDYDSVIPHWNTKLSDGNPEFIQLNNILGPESIAIDKNGLIYTGLADGRLVELDPSNKYKVRTVTRIKESAQCQDNVAVMADCGRFLQVRFLNETLYSVDANTGLYRIEPKSGKKTFVGPKALSKVLLYNSFVFDPNEPNLVYLTVSSNRWNLLNIIWGFIELDASGHVVALDLNTGKRVIVLDKLMMANGIEVDTKRDQLLVSVSMASKILSIPLKDVRAAFKTAKDGDRLSSISSRSLISLLPGIPDNLVADGDMLYIALPFVKLNGKDLMDLLSTMPNVRKALGRFIYGAGKLLEYVCLNLYHHPLLETAYRELKCGHVNYRVSQSDKSAVVEYNLATGSSRLMGSNTFGFVSEAVPDGKGNLYLGSFRSPFIVKQKI